MSAPKPSLVCVGRIVQEMIFFPQQVKGPVLGSPPAYCSVAAARQGTPTGIVTKIGLDFPQTLLQPIIDASVDSRGILLSESSTNSQLIYDGRGNKEIRYPSMSDPIRPEDIPQAFRSCDIIYICPMDEDVLVEDLSGVTALGKISAVDLGGYGGVHMSKDRRQAIASLAEYAIRVSSYFDIVKASVEDAISIFGQDDPLESSRKLLASGPQVVVITLGANGALVSTSEKQWHVPPVSGNVIDTTGGGDTFMAGFLSEYIQSQDPLKSAQRGCATAISVIEKTGGVLVDRMPTRQQVQERINQNYF